MKQFYAMLGTILLCVGLAGCDRLSDVAPQASEQKRVDIKDTDLKHQFTIRSIPETDYILLALAESKPNVSNPNISALMKSNVTIGKRSRAGFLDLPIYEGFLDYWTGSGSYWVVFVQLNSNATFASRIVISKEKMDFYDRTTYLRNVDFMLPLELDLDIGDILQDALEGL
jgi:hypothetical protein